MDLASAEVHCPYCGEPLELLVEPVGGPQDYVEDCHVCCQPIRVLAEVSADGDADVRVLRDDET